MTQFTPDEIEAIQYLQNMEDLRKACQESDLNDDEMQEILVMLAEESDPTPEWVLDETEPIGPDEGFDSDTIFIKENT